MKAIDGAMEQMSPKERVLKRIREALTNAPVNLPSGVDLESNVYIEGQGVPEEVFAMRFIEGGGLFLYCEQVKETLDTFSELVRKNGWQNRIFCCDSEVEELLDLADIPYGKRVNDALVRDVVFCSCRYLLAQDGSILWNSSSMGRRAMAKAKDVVFVATVDQVMPDFRTAVRHMKVDGTGQSSFLSRWNGKSAFIDIDGVSMKGLGPENIYLVLIDLN